MPNELDLLRTSEVLLPISVPIRAATKEHRIVRATEKPSSDLLGHINGRFPNARKDSALLDFGWRLLKRDDGIDHVLRGCRIYELDSSLSLRHFSFICSGSALQF